MEFEEGDLGGFFTMKELRATGADLEKIAGSLIFVLVTFRKVIGRPVTLMKHGLTSGQHAPDGWHPKGMAVDFHVKFDMEKEGIDFVVERMQRAGFRGIGVYYNGKVYSFHGDLRPLSEFWSGTKKAPGVGKWVYGKMISPLTPK